MHYTMHFDHIMPPTVCGREFLLIVLEGINSGGRKIKVGRG